MANTTKGTAPDEKKPIIKYTLDKDTGVLTRTDEDGEITIGKLDGTAFEFDSRAMQKYRAPVLQFFAKNQIKWKTLALKGEKRDVEQPKGKIPPCPKRTIEAGDKTPAVVEWYRKYKPEEYKVRYGIKGEGTINKISYSKDEKTGKRITHVTPVSALIAERKMHLTEKPEASDGQVDEEQQPDEGGEE
jgi:hypothetical protein